MTRSIDQQVSTFGQSSQPAPISVRELWVAFGAEPPVLRGLSLDVAPGEIVALVGASGCGKSTLLRSIAGLIAPSAGSIEMDRLATSHRSGELAYVLQAATLLPWRTVDENIGLPLEIAGGWSSFELQRAVSAVRHAVGLDENAGRKFPRALSGGMQMRVSIARALVTDPNILLLDEPFAALDDILRMKLNDLLLELWSSRPRTILFVTHNIAEAVYLSHRIAVLGDGRVATAVPNDLDWPRCFADRASHGFAAMYSRVSQVLAKVAQ